MQIICSQLPQFELNVRAVGTHFHFECILVLDRNIKSTVRLRFVKMLCATRFIKEWRLKKWNVIQHLFFCSKITSL